MADSNCPSCNKAPLALVAHFKKKDATNADGTEMSDGDKRKAALDKARQYQKQKQIKGK
jgi:hypothetical protein